MRSLFSLLSVCLLALIARTAGAVPPDPLIGLVSAEGRASVGLLVRSEQSAYRDVGARFDVMPLYVFESKHAYFYSYRAGIKVTLSDARYLDVFMVQRFEGFPSQSLPPVLAGMAMREQGVDAGIALRQRHGALETFGETRIDISGVSEGAELRMGFRYHADGERLSLLPYAVASFRNASLNDYYYGVRPNEARPGRPRYQAGGGLDLAIGVDMRWRVSEGWQVLGGVGLTHLSAEIRESPVVGHSTLLSGYVGAAYDFGTTVNRWSEREPVIVRLLYGRSTDCNLITTMTLRCVSTATEDRTGIAGVQFGRPFLENVNGWPLDFVGFVGVLRHREHGLQEDGWSVQGYMKVQYYGFPWSDYVRTRVGFGAGLSVASQIPYVEARDQARRERGTSRLLNYLEPTVDVNLGDIVRVKALTDTYLGFGVSHRSGIFGQSRALGNVNGGSNFIYFYVESLLSY
jgi:outer membrane protein